jgi:hypothetical protein
MVQPFYNEEAVTADGETYRLVINFRTIDATESVLGRSYDSVLREMLIGKPSVGLQARVVWGLLREHHSDITLEQADALARGKSGKLFGFAIGNLFQAAFPFAGEPKEKGPNPPKRRGASKLS